MNKQDDDFLKDADKAQIGIVAEFLEFLRYNKKLWLIPILFVLLGVGALVVLGGSAAAPFIYTVF